jgi:hypothetical protein
LEVLTAQPAGIGRRGMGVCSMKEVANGHPDNEASRLAASLAQTRRRSERAERDRRLEKLAVEVERLASPTWFAEAYRR